MVTDLLVGNPVDAGRKLLQALDARHFPCNAAFWLLSAESGVWRLVLATEVFDRSGPLEAYREVDRVLFGEKLPLSLQDISVVSASNPLVRLLASAVPTGPSGMEGTRIRSTNLDHTFVEDAYIYRLP